MWSKVLQDWKTIEHGAGAPARIIQSADDWQPTEAVQDAQFLVEVSYVSVSGSHLYLRLETAPSRESTLFLPMESPTAVDLAGLGGSNTTRLMVAGATPGPPIASYVRWAIDSADSTTWLVTFRITMSGI